MEEKNQCPHCRTQLNVSQLVQCRFMDDLANQLNGLLFSNAIVSSTSKDMCHVHSAPLFYYCEDCQEGVCSDCCVLDSKHRSHTLKHLHAVVKDHRTTIQEHTRALYEQLNAYSKTLADLDDKVATLESSKNVLTEAYKKLWSEAMEDIDDQYSEKIDAILDLKRRVTANSDILRATLETLETQLNGAYKTELITESDKIIAIIDKLKLDHPRDETPLIPSIDFISTVIPPYDKAVFRIDNFKERQKSDEPVYSPLLRASGLEWRLKVYCRGKQPHHSDSLSVFVEIVSGSSAPAKYQYKVQLINLVGLNNDSDITREFTSEFTVGECWGYNRFCKLDSLFNNGFYDPDEDAIELVYHVRAPNFFQRCKDLEYFIKYNQTSFYRDVKASSLTTANWESSQTLVEAYPSTVPHESRECDITDMVTNWHSEIPIDASQPQNASSPRTETPEIVESESNHEDEQLFDYRTSLQSLNAEMTSFENFVDAVTKEVELFESIINKNQPTDIVFEQILQDHKYYTESIATGCPDDYSGAGNSSLYRVCNLSDIDQGQDCLDDALLPSSIQQLDSSSMFEEEEEEFDGDESEEIGSPNSSRFNNESGHLVFGVDGSLVSFDNGIGHGSAVDDDCDELTIQHATLTNDSPIFALSSGQVFSTDIIDELEQEEEEYEKFHEDSTMAD